MEPTLDENQIKINNILNISEECDTIQELENLIKSNKKFTAYNGFEPSGRMHIAQAITTVLNANIIIENGGQMIIYIADWFAKLNHKMDGNLTKIKDVGKYFIEIFKACGLNLNGTKFIWASDFINSDDNYWPRVLEISTENTISRIKRCTQIMGRKEGDDLSASQIIYPCMQCADIFELGVDICQLGVDQRKVNMLAREYASKHNINPPIILSHHMLMSLKGNKSKMSKSDPANAIFMEDTYEEIISKIMGAFCPDDIYEYKSDGTKIVINPIFEYIKYILLRWFNKLTLCEKEYININDIETDFASMNKKQLKENVAEYINIIIEPVRQHFDDVELNNLLDRVISYRVTR